MNKDSNRLERMVAGLLYLTIAFAYIGAILLVAAFCLILFGAALFITRYMLLHA